MDGSGAAAAAAGEDPLDRGAPVGDPTISDTSAEFFSCCVCLDLLYKPIVLVCGHISCFWCIHKAMSPARESHCAMCRQPYKYFSGICPLLHLLLMKMEPVAYKRREMEVLEEEKKADCFSPQFVDHLTTEKIYAKKVDYEKSEDWNIIEDRKLPVSGLANEICVSDVLCVECNHLLFRPAVLNCGHVYCEPCMISVTGEAPRCQVCQSLHPGDLPSVCLELDHFLEKQFPKEYALRRLSHQRNYSKAQNGGPSSCAFQTKKSDSKSASHFCDDPEQLRNVLSNAHLAVGCDSCGMFPIMGKRYRCKDCKERIGFDLCEACYNTSPKVPGRFNQQHTPDHTFELDDSQLIGKIFWLMGLEQDPDQGLPDGAEGPGNPDSMV